MSHNNGKPRPAPQLPHPRDCEALLDLQLRDLFAAFVLGGLASRPDWQEYSDADAADEAYSAADAMLHRRQFWPVPPAAE